MTFPADTDAAKHYVTRFDVRDGKYASLEMIESPHITRITDAKNNIVAEGTGRTKAMADAALYYAMKRVHQAQCDAFLDACANQPKETT